MVMCTRCTLYIYWLCQFNLLIPTKCLISNPVHGEVYSIQHYVIKFVNDLRQVFSTNKTERHDITDILLKVALNIITLAPCLTLPPCLHQSRKLRTLVYAVKGVTFVSISTIFAIRFFSCSESVVFFVVLFSIL